MSHRHHYHLEFRKTGSNSNSAATGTLYLMDGKKVLFTSPVFSGGTNPDTGEQHAPIGDGHYTIRLDIRNVVTPGKVTLERTGPMEYHVVLLPDDGLQVIPSGFEHNPQWEWGSVRMHLNQPRGEHRKDHSGNYLHGKQRPSDWTHGCICERSEVILKQLQHLDHRHVHCVPLVVRH